MTPEMIQQKIFYGYAKASFKLGATYSLYRSAVPINPITEENLIGTIQMSPSVSWDYMKAQSYGKAELNACIDAQSANAPYSCLVGDYLVPAIDPQSGIIDETNTYFVQSLQFDLPPRVVICNNTLSIIRPSQNTGPGYQGYAGYTPGTSQTIMTDMPASVLKVGRGMAADTKLPTDSREPMWTILMPNLGGVIIRIGDIITDNINEEYAVSENELTDLGWRITAMQVVNAR